MESIDNYKKALNNMRLETNVGAEFCTNLALAQGEIEGAVKDSANPFFKSSYADMASVIESFRKVFAKYGFSVLQSIDSDDDKYYLTTILLHKSGQRLVAGPMRIIIKDLTNPQAFGSSVTYFRRYAMASLLRIPQVDDDGNAAAQVQKPMQRPVQRPPFQRPT